MTLIAGTRQTDLTPDEARDFIRFRAAVEYERDNPPPTPESKAEPEKPKVDTKDIEVFMSWDFLAAGWLLKQVGLGTRDGTYTSSGQLFWLPRKVLVWAILAYPRFRRMLRIVRSGSAADDVVDARWKACNDCPQLKIGSNGESYCGACGCPDWHFSRLRIKNRLAANHCPTRQHPGEYVKLVAHLWPNRKKPGAATKPAGSGCGGQRNG